MARKSPTSLAVTALLLSCGIAQAQQTTLAPVTVTGQSAAPAADVTGFGDFPIKELPLSATVIGRRQIEASGARRLADLLQFDASVGDAYNAPGYWDFISIRGFTLDNIYNYRREGLAVNAQTVIPLDNKDRIEILKGTSGIQAGVSSPGGLVNYVVKRPTEQDLREVRVELSSRSSLLAAADLGGRFGVDRAFGYRVNVAHENLRPLIRNMDGQRSLAALAGNWRIGRDSVLEAEVEWSHKSQASQTGFSLLGNTLPDVPDPRLNLNNQPWAQPSVFDAVTGTLRFSQSLGSGWRWSAQAGTQRLKTDDYTAFPFGCGAEGNFDRFCSDGSFDYYDFRSIDERRRQDAASLNLKGKVMTGSVTHDLVFGLLTSRARDRTLPFAYNWVGTGTIDGASIVPEDPTPTVLGTPRNEKTLELSASDAIRWNDKATTWLGVRHTRLNRGYRQSITTPWVAMSYKLTPDVTAYASHGQGVETARVPDNGGIYANPGEVLPALKSKQWEFGLKGDGGGLGWQLALFDIRRPMTNIAYCDRTFAACVGQFDGRAVHQGLEASAQWVSGPWRLDGSATWLHARRDASVLEPANNGKSPPNVPDAVLRGSVAWKVPQARGLELKALVSHEGKRSVLADESVVLPAWTRLDVAVRYETQLGRVSTAWTLGIDNLTDRRYWKESPFQFGHVYLYPGAPRTLRLSLTAAL
jgi:iron complex outermembrane receptor protein